MRAWVYGMVVLCRCVCVYCAAVPWLYRVRVVLYRESLVAYISVSVSCRGCYRHRNDYIDRHMCRHRHFHRRPLPSIAVSVGSCSLLARLPNGGSGYQKLGHNISSPDPHVLFVWSDWKDSGRVVDTARRAISISGPMSPGTPERVGVRQTTPRIP